MNIYEGASANEIWKNIAHDFALQQKSSEQMSRCGITHEMLHVLISLKNPRKRWVFSRFPPINPAFALSEVMWILNGKNESNILNFWNPVLPKYAGDKNYYYGAYGYRLRKNLGFDQLYRAYKTLKDNQNSRQTVLQIWDGRKDLPKKKGIPNDQDIPCNICSMLKIRNKKLEWMQIVRSNDLFLGLPYNFIQFTMLQELMAGWLGIEVGEYNQLSDSLHIYDKHLNYIMKNNPDDENKICVYENYFKFSFEETKKYVNVIYMEMEKMTLSNCKDVFLNLPSLNLPVQFKDIIYIIGADAAMRLGYDDTTRHLAKRCCNQEYASLWKNWAKRWMKKHMGVS